MSTNSDMRKKVRETIMIINDVCIKDKDKFIRTVPELVNYVKENYDNMELLDIISWSCQDLFQFIENDISNMARHTIIKADPYLLPYFNDRVIDRIDMLIACKADGLLYIHCPSYLLYDEDIQLTAVRQNGNAIQYMKHCPINISDKVFEAAILQNRWCTRFIDIHHCSKEIQELAKTENFLYESYDSQQKKPYNLLWL